MSNRMNRKEFLRTLGILGVAGIGGSSFLSSCAGDTSEKAPPQSKSETPSETAANDPCGDTTGLTEVDLKARENLKYAATSADPAKACDICNFWTAPVEGATCGGCQLLKGSINPKGSCNSFVAKGKG